jgi:hypothetical protein
VGGAAQGVHPLCGGGCVPPRRGGGGARAQQEGQGDQQSRRVHRALILGQQRCTQGSAGRSAVLFEQQQFPNDVTQQAGGYRKNPIAIVGYG